MDEWFSEYTINDFEPRQSIQDRLGLQAMLDRSVIALWAHLQTERVE